MWGDLRQYPDISRGDPMLLYQTLEGGRMRHKAEARKSGKVTKIVNGGEVREELAEITVEGTDPAHAKLRIVNFLMDEMGKRQQLQESDGVDVVVGSDEVEPRKT
jgi:hypothetical protein